MIRNNFSVLEKERRKSQINKFFKQKQFSFYGYNDGLTDEIYNKYGGHSRCGSRHERQNFYKLEILYICICAIYKIASAAFEA
jgi:hypothetical protein